MKIKKLQYLTALGLGLAMQSLVAGNIVDVSVASLPNDQRVIKLRFDRDMVKPSGFITSSPARIALDFAGTGATLNQPVLQYNDALLSQIAVAQDSGKTRVLLNLNHPSQYNAEIRGNEVWVYVNRSNSTAATPASETQQAPAQQTASASAANVGIDFRKGNGNEGIIDIAPAGFRGTPEIKQTADRLVITLKNNQLPAAAQRNLDVADFGTPVRAISLRRLGNNTEITVRNHGNWSHRLTQANGRYSITIQPQNAAAESGLNRQARTNFTGKRISLDFQDVEVRTILQILAKESNMNIVASESVTGKMTLTLKDVPWDQALDLVMQARNLDSRRNGNIINVAPKEELLAKERADLEGRKVIEEMGALYSRTFQLRYKDVNEFRRILNINENGGRNANDTNSLLSARGSAVIDPGTNTLIIKDNATVIKQFEDLIAQLDVPARQVMIEARIVEANEGFSRDLGVRFGYNREGIARSNTGVTAGWSGAQGVSFGGANSNIPMVTGSSAISIVHSLASGALNLELSAMQEQGRGKVVSSPRVLTQDRYEATIKEGVQIPYQEASSSGATTTSFKDAVLSMIVTPQITPDGKIIMNIRLNKDSRGSDTLSGPSINTRSLQTRAMVEDGGTIILGGIFSEDESNTVRKVPLLGDIPVVGSLFRSTERNHERKELLIFITPRIMGDEGSVLRY